MSEEQLAKYDAWIRELEVRQGALAARRGRHLRLFGLALLVSPLGFVHSAWIGAATLFTGMLVCTFGVYVVLVRERDYRHELAAVRQTAAELRGALPAHDAPR